MLYSNVLRKQNVFVRSLSSSLSLTISRFRKQHNTDFFSLFAQSDASTRAFVRGMRSGETPLVQMAQGQIELGSNEIQEEEGGTAPTGESVCTSVRPSFCTMVDWEVSGDLGIVKNGFSDVELGIEMAYFQQPGSFDCRRRYKQLACQYNFPRCDKDVAVKAPCRSVCEDFASKCPGADVQCNSYPLEQCLEIDLLADGVSKTFLSSFVVFVSSLLLFLQ
jgi:hypothetical protein